MLCLLNAHDMNDLQRMHALGFNPSQPFAKYMDRFKDLACKFGKEYTLYLDI